MIIYFLLLLCVNIITIKDIVLATTIETQSYGSLELVVPTNEYFLNGVDVVTVLHLI